MDNLIYAVRIKLLSPLPGSATEEFDRMMKKYRLHPRPNKPGEEPLEVITFSPDRWYTSKELLNFFKLARGQVENTWEFGIKRINKKDAPREEKDDEIDDLKESLIKDLQKLKTLFPKMVGEYKKRFEQAIEGKSPDEQASIKLEGDYEWVEHPDAFIKKIQDVVLLDDEINKIEESKALGKDVELERRENQKTEPKQTGWHAELWTKFKDIEHELKQYKSDIGRLSDKFKTMPIPAPEGEISTKTADEKTFHQVKPGPKFRKVYKYLSDDKKKALVDKYLKSEGGELELENPSSVKWDISSEALNKEKSKVSNELEDLEHQQSLVKDDEAKFKEMEKTVGEKKEELGLLKDLSATRDSREKFIDTQKEGWTKQQSHAAIMEAEDGEAAIEAIGNNFQDIGLILCDWNMPNMSGIEVVRALAQIPTLATLPVMMITTEGSEAKISQAKAANPNLAGYVVKPFTPQYLKEMITPVLKKAG